MADTILKVNGRDLSGYLKLYEQEIGAVDAGRIAPQFAGNPALSEGAVAISDAVSNKHWELGMLLKARDQALQNLVTDPSMEGTGWAVGTGGANHAGAATSATPTESSGAVAGKQVLRVVCPATAFTGAEIAVPGTFASGTAYTFSIHTTLVSGTGTLTARIIDVASGDGTTVDFTATAARQRPQVTWTPSGARSQVYIEVFNRTAAAVTFDLDGAQVVAASSAPFYFDGDTAGCTWDGARNASTSSTLVGVDGVNKLVRDLQVDLVKGAVVEYRPEGATLSTYSDLESGEFRPQYAHPLYRHGYVPGVLELWTRPYGHTGTTRLVASAAGSGPLQFSVTGVLGDVAAQADITFAPGGSQIGGVAYGVKYPAASVVLIRNAGASFYPGGAGMTVVGDGEGLGSQAVRLDAAANADARVLGDAISAASAPDYAGRYRILVLARHEYNVASVAKANLVAIDRNGATLGFATLTATNALLDLGEVQIAPSQVIAAGALNSEINYYANLVAASKAYGIRIGGAILLPLDTAVGIVVPNNAISAYQPFAAPDTLVLRSIGDTSVRRVATSGRTLVDFTARLRGGPPRVPAVGSPAASSPAAIVAFTIGATSGAFNGTAPQTVSVAVRERFSFFR